jgi:alkaline phosphatase
VLGEDGNDRLGGGQGADTIDGGDGDDFIGGGFGADLIQGGTGNDTIGGGLGDDTVLGGEGNDFLAGGGRDDVLDGGAGNDTLNGGEGNDLMTGGEGVDTFVFNRLTSGEADIITDFDVATETVILRSVANFDTLDITDTVAGAVVTVDGQTITFEAVLAADLTADNFLFG